MKKLFASLYLIISTSALFAQYTENGSAAATNCHCYVLTPDALTTSGSVWNNNKIDLNISFDFQFNVFLGCNGIKGADGIVFALQPISTSVGSTGGGMGFQGITPSIGITLDTWQNMEFNDPAYDHIDFQYNGNLTHKGVPTPISANSNKVADCNWHTLRVQWDAATKTYTAYFDGQLRITTINDLVKNVFNNNPLVFWGFTGSTGGASNLQQFCTALNPIYNLLPAQKRCIGEPIAFRDSTISFAPLLKRYWNFGDGTPIDSVNINPVHSYAAAGDYTVLQTVVGIDGCSEINKQILRIGSKPIAAFTLVDACADSMVNFKDASTGQVGTINRWNWDLNFGTTSTMQNPARAYPIYTGSTFPVKLSVNTLEGCVSDTAINTLKIFARPTANFTNAAQACSNTLVSFKDSSYLLSSGINFGATINNWVWNFGDGQSSALQNPQISFAGSGNKLVSLIVKTTNGCNSLPITKTLTILQKPIAYFTNNVLCQLSVAQFTDSSYSTNGEVIKSWWWNLGNGTQALTKNTTATYNTFSDITIQLVVSNSNNCMSDTLKKVIAIGAKPIANFATVSPLCANTLVQFIDSSLTESCVLQNWFWHFDDGDSSTIQNSRKSFFAGNHSINLMVKNSAGCFSDIVTKNIFVNAAPAINFNFVNTCKNAVVTFTGIDNTGGTINQWKWNFGDGTSALDKITRHIYKDTATYPISLYAASNNGCSVIKDSSIIIYGTNVFAGNDTIAAPNQPIQLQATGGLSYQWSPSDGLNNPAIANPVAINNTNQTYYLKASTPIGCDSYDTINIKVYAGPQLYLPTAFTPNGDGLNDVFKVFPVGMVQFDCFTIYNRYGKIIFITKQIGLGWDGTFNRNPQMAGTYIWTVAGMDYKGSKIMRKGTVVLVR